MKKLLTSSKSFVSLMSTTNFFFLRLDHFIQLLNTSSVIIGLEFVLWILCLTVSENLSALFVVPEESRFAHFLSCGSEFLWRLEFVGQTVSQLVSPFYHDWRTTTDWTTNLRLESDRLVYGSHHLLAPGWPVVRRAPCRWWRHRTRSHSGTHSRPRIPGCMVQ